MKYYFEAFKKYTDLKSSTKRKEYWLFMLINVIVFMIFQILGVYIKFPMLGYLYVIFSVFPVAAASVRRLVDAGKSKYWLFAALIFPIGTLMVVYFLCMKSKQKISK